MRSHVYAWLAVLLAACLTLPFVAASTGILGSPLAKPVMAAAFLKVSDATGHGSGVHIGQGYVLTAAHVVRDNASMTLTDSEKRTLAGEVLWVNKGYDVALIRAPGYKHVASAPLSCAKNYPHQQVTAYGNPLDLEFAFTSGQVNGVARQWAIWRSVVPADMSIIPGQSGGAIVDRLGNVVGIAVGVMIWQYGLTGQGFFVPASVICELMGRA